MQGKGRIAPVLQRAVEEYNSYCQGHGTERCVLWVLCRSPGPQVPPGPGRARAAAGAGDTRPGRPAAQNTLLSTSGCISDLDWINKH